MKSVLSSRTPSSPIVTSSTRTGGSNVKVGGRDGGKVRLSVASCSAGSAAILSIPTLGKHVLGLGSAPSNAVKRSPKSVASPVTTGSAGSNSITIPASSSHSTTSESDLSRRPSSKNSMKSVLSSRTPSSPIVTSRKTSSGDKVRVGRGEGGARPSAIKVINPLKSPDGSIPKPVTACPSFETLVAACSNQPASSDSRPNSFTSRSWRTIIPTPSCHMNALLLELASKDNPTTTFPSAETSKATEATSPGKTPKPIIPIPSVCLEA